MGVGAAAPAPFLLERQAMANMKLINECNMFLNSIHNAELDNRTVDARMLKVGLRAYVTLTGEWSDNADVVRIIREGVKAHAE